MSRNSDNYISLSEAAKTCAYTQEYLSLRARQGKLGAVKLGRNWVTTKSWLNDYISVIGMQNSSKSKTVKRVTDSVPKTVFTRSKESPPTPFPPHNLPTGEPVINTKTLKDRLYELRFNLKPKFESLKPVFAIALTGTLIAGPAVLGKENIAKVYEEVSPVTAGVQSDLLEGLSFFNQKIDNALAYIDNRLDSYTDFGAAALNMISDKNISVSGRNISVGTTVAGVADLLSEYSNWVAKDVASGWIGVKESMLGRIYVVVNDAIERELLRYFNVINNFLINTASKISDVFGLVGREFSTYFK